MNSKLISTPACISFKSNPSRHPSRLCKKGASPKSHNICLDATAHAALVAEVEMLLLDLLLNWTHLYISKRIEAAGRRHWELLHTLHLGSPDTASRLGNSSPSVVDKLSWLGERADVAHVLDVDV